MKIKAVIILTFLSFLSCRDKEKANYYTIEGFVKIKGTDNYAEGIPIEVHYLPKGMGFNFSAGIKASAITDKNGYYKIKYSFKAYHIDPNSGSLTLRMGSVPNQYVPLQYPNKSIDQSKVKIGEKLRENFEVADKVGIKIRLKRTDNNPNLIHTCFVGVGEYPSFFQRYYSPYV
jgi:hypothetical protein